MAVAFASLTEERIDIGDFEDDLPPRSLPGLRPARFKEIANGERALYLDMRRLHERLVRHLWQVLRLPGRAALASVPFQLGTEQLAALDQASGWFARSVMGDARDAAAFAQPSNAVIDVKTPIWEGAPILPGHLRTAFGAGLERAVDLTGADTPALLGIRNEAAQQQMLKGSFTRLSEGARVKLADVLTAEDYPGGSVRDILVNAANEGKNPLETARELRDKFKGIRDYNWPRLARTETAIAQNDAMQAEYEAEGYRVPQDADGNRIRLPSYHPNCVCGATIDPKTGWILPDVAATACEVCQAALSWSKAVIGDKKLGGNNA